MEQKQKIFLIVLIFLSVSVAVSGVKAGHSKCHSYPNDKFYSCYFDWLAEYNGWCSGDRCLTREEDFTAIPSPVGSWAAALDSLFQTWGSPPAIFAPPAHYTLAGERCARSRWSAWEGQYLYTCGDGVYVRGEWRGKLNFKDGNYKFSVLTHDGVALYVSGYGWIISDINNNDRKQLDSTQIYLSSGYRDVAVFWNFRTPTYNSRPWIESPTLKLWWENLTEPLLVSLIATPFSGDAPLNSVSLTADASGNGSIPTPFNYTFYCNRSDSGTNVTSPWDAKFDGTNDIFKFADGICNYSEPGNYTAKVILERGSAPPAEARFNIVVNMPIPPDQDGQTGEEESSGGQFKPGPVKEIKP